MPTSVVSQDDLYAKTIADYGDALDRLCRAYEADTDKRRDLAQEIHIALWRSFATWIKAEWGVSELGWRARFCSLTAAGRKQLHIETVNWDRLAKLLPEY
jgi:hypothetical protein